MPRATPEPSRRWAAQADQRRRQILDQRADEVLRLRQRPPDPNELERDAAAVQQINVDRSAWWLTLSVDCPRHRATPGHGCWSLPDGKALGVCDRRWTRASRGLS